jgi:hypothetical protein
MGNKENIVIQKININVETNIEGEKPFELKYKTINNPIQSGEYASNTEEFDYPYFTPDIVYSPEVLSTYLNRDYGKVVRTFFDINLFSEMVNESKKKNKDSDTGANKIVDNNIYLTLLFLFPMRYPQSANVNSSYDKYIKKQLINDYKKYFPSSDTLSSAFFGQIYDIKKEAIREYSYINTSQGIATVTEIIWLNDVFNNKKYRDLIDKLIQYDNWYSEKKETINEEITNAQNDLITSMQKNELNFTNKDVKKTEDQKNISYSKIDLTNDIIEVIKKYIVVVHGSDTNRNNCMDALYNKLFSIDENNKIKIAVDKEKNKIDVNRLWDEINEILFDLNVNTRGGLFVNSRAISNAYHVIFDFLKYETIKDTLNTKTIKNVNIDSYIKLNYKNNDEKMEEIKFSEEAVIATRIRGKPENILIDKCNIINNTFDIYENIKKYKDFIKMIEDIKSDLSQLVDKFNRNYSNIANVSKYSSNQLLAIDINVDKAVKEMKTIIGIFEDIEDKKIVFDDKNTEILNSTFKQIMNSVDSLKTFFSESSIRENRITGVSSIQIKLEKILKKSNEIKALQLVQQYLFSDITKGIYLYYDDEKTESSEILKTELKKSKYSFFTNTVKYIKDNFLNVESTNKELTKLMRYYFENTGNEFIEKVVNVAKKGINENIIEANELLNIGVTKITSNKENRPMYEITIYMEVIIGKLDYQKQQKIKCEYRDEKLLAYFDKFASNPKNYEIIKKKAITLKDGKENKKNEKKMKGGKTMRKKKYLQYLQYNKRYTYKQR